MIKRSIGLAALILAVMFAGQALVAGPASAADRPASTPSTSGYVEICDDFGTAGVDVAADPTFHFSLSHGSTTDATVAVSPNNDGTTQCSGEISVPAGSETITEDPAPWYQVTSIQPAFMGGNPIVAGTTDLTAGTVNVTVAPGAVFSAVLIRNALVTGYLKVCKRATTNTDLSGDYSFGISGADGFSATTSVSIEPPLVLGASCGTAIEVPAGTATVTEIGTNLSVSGITATINGSTSAIADGAPAPDLTTGTATVDVLASSSHFVRTIVTYTDEVVWLKVCTIWDPRNGPEPGGPLQSFPFSITASEPAGPVLLSNGSMTYRTWAGQFVCSAPTAYLPGTEVSVTEGVVPGTKVEINGIRTAGAESVVPDSTSVTSRTISVVLGTPNTWWNGSNDRAVVTFSNEAAAPGVLEICKIAGVLADSSPYPTGTMFKFVVEVAGSTATYTTTVPLGSCEPVTGADGKTVLFPFNSVETISEMSSAGNQTTAISVDPSEVTELVGRSMATTGEAVEPTVPDLGAIGESSSVSVVIGEQSCTKVTFADVDVPPAPSGPSTTSGSSGGSGPPSGSSPPSPTGVTSPGTASLGSNTGSIKLPVVVLSSRAIHNLRVKLAVDQRTLKKLEKRHANAKKHSVKVALAKKIAALKAAERLLKRDIKKIK